MASRFDEMGIDPQILKSLEEMGFETPTEVQARGIPHILKGEDLIAISKTGSGKTAVFGIPMLQMIDPAAEGLQGLILAPTRELAVQVESDLEKMGQYMTLKTTAVYGQHSMNTEIQAFKDGVSVVVGTPGRVFDHIRHGTLKTNNVRFLVLDEADRMLDMGFFDQVMKIVRTIPRNRITLLFSATMPPEVLRICTDYMKRPVTIEIESQTKTVDTIRQVYYRVERNRKNYNLNRILMHDQPDSCMIFCNTKIAVDRVKAFLDREGHRCEALHGDIPQSKRLRTIQQFRRGVFHILVATDVAARGLHIEGLALVINYDVPEDRDSYIHRIGRTGRIGNEGRAITLVTAEDIMSLYEIEEHIGAMITEGDLPTDADMEASRASARAWMKSRAEKADQAEKEEKEELGESADHVEKPEKPKRSRSRDRSGKETAAGRQGSAGRPGKSNAEKLEKGPEEGQDAGKPARQSAEDQLPANGEAPKKRRRRRRKKKPQEPAGSPGTASEQAVSGHGAGRDAHRSASGSDKTAAAATGHPAKRESFIKKLLGKIFG